jgi:hypothetical protein
MDASATKYSYDHDFAPNGGGGGVLMVVGRRYSGKTAATQEIIRRIVAAGIYDRGVVATPCVEERKEFELSLADCVLSSDKSMINLFRQNTRLESPALLLVSECIDSLHEWADCCDYNNNLHEWCIHNSISLILQCQTPEDVPLLLLRNISSWFVVDSPRTHPYLVQNIHSMYIRSCAPRRVFVEAWQNIDIGLALCVDSGSAELRWLRYGRRTRDYELQETQQKHNVWTHSILNYLGVLPDVLCAVVAGYSYGPFKLQWCLK